MITAPDAPIGWPMAIAPPFGLVFFGVEAEHLGHGQRLRGKGFVGLDDADIVELEAGLGQRDAGRRGSGLRP
jgi:hypothetical protein